MPRASEVTDPLDLVVGERLRAARMASGLSQAQLGKAMNLSLQQIQEYELGTHRLSASMLMRAGKALGVPAAKLFPDPDIDLTTPEAVDIQILRGRAALADYFLVMSPTQRALLLEIAQEFARLAP